MQFYAFLLLVTNIMEDNLYCVQCKKHYSHSKTYKRHLKKFHPQVYEDNTYKDAKNQKCPLCNLCVKFRSEIEKHLETDHHIKEIGYRKVLHFTTESEFVEWKTRIEKETRSVYVQNEGSKRSKDDVITTYFYCNRSGYYHPKGDGKRALKMKGSTKINSICPAKIKKIRSDGGIEVQHLEMHTGHDSLQYVSLGKDERDEIALKIRQNTPFDQILEELRNSSGNEAQKERLKLVTKKDLWNIKYAYRNVRLPESLTVGGGDMNLDGLVEEYEELSTEQME